MGWYHSHPGYGCWLSGIDVGTQMTQQQYQDPFLAIVVDPHRTIAAGKVEIGAFRTYPEVTTQCGLHRLGWAAAFETKIVYDHVSKELQQGDVADLCLE